MRETVRLRWMAAVSLVVFTATIAAPPMVLAQQAPIRGAQQGMSTRKKMVLLAGAAAMYWLYRRHQNSQGVGPQGRYYRSRNGGIYYRDARTHRPIRVQAPPANRPIEVPVDEYRQYVGRLPSGYDETNGGNRVLTAPPGPGYR